MLPRLVGIVGAGPLCSDLALKLASYGVRVKLVDSSAVALSHSHIAIEHRLNKQVSAGVSTQADIYKTLQRLSVSVDIRDLAQADFVVEGASQHQQMKGSILQTVEQVVAPTTLIGTFTKLLSVSRLGSYLRHPERLIGVHVSLHPGETNFIELVPGVQTSEATVLAACQLSEVIEKKPIVVKDSAGFLVNRVLAVQINECVSMLNASTAKLEDVDFAFKDVMGSKIGPLELADRIGLEAVLEELVSLHKTTGDDKYSPSPLLVQYVAAGWTGVRVGRGFYRYT
jgi:3-hydroxybutyryl-CoA dehydrogenase